LLLTAPEATAASLQITHVAFIARKTCIKFAGRQSESASHPHKAAAARGHTCKTA